MLIIHTPAIDIYYYGWLVCIFFQRERERVCVCMRVCVCVCVLVHGVCPTNPGGPEFHGGGWSGGAGDRTGSEAHSGAF